MMKKMAYLSIITSLIGASVISINFGVFQLSLFRAIIIIIVLAMITMIILKKESLHKSLNKRANSYSIIFMIIWLAYSMITIIWVKDYGAWVKATYFLSLGVMCILLYDNIFKTSNDILISFRVISVMAILHNLIGWYEIITGDYLFLANSQLIYKRDHFPASMFGNTNNFATFMLISIFITYVCVVNSKKTIEKTIYICTLISSIFLLTMTKSRANMIGFILAAVFLIFMSKRKTTERKTISIIMLLLLRFILLIPIVLNDLFFMTIKNLHFNFGGIIGSDSLRINLIKNGLDFLIRTFGVGTGAGNIEYWMANYGTFNTKGVLDIHNWWMEILTGYGVIVFVLYVIFYLALFRSLFKTYKTSKDKKKITISLGIMCCMIGFVVGSVSASSIVNNEWLWVFWAIVIAFQGLSSLDKSENLLPAPTEGNGSNMKNIIFLTSLNLWSMDKNKGAPSFFKTIEGYSKDNWNVVLINPEYHFGVTPMIEGVKNITFKPIFFSLCKMKRCSFLGRILHSIQCDYMLCKLGKKALEEVNNQAMLYSYEVHGVKAGKMLKEQYNLPFVTRFQGTVLGPIKNNWLNRLRKYPHFQALKTSADITIMTDDGTFGKRVLKDLNNQSEQVMFWRNGVDLSKEEQKNHIQMENLRKELGLSQSDKILLTVSRLASWKKVNRAIEALAVVVNKRPECKLIIVGDGDEKQNLVELTTKLNLLSNVIFTGAIPQTEVVNYIDLADIFLSLYDLSNVGNPLLEAMSCGKPIITLDVGDTASLISHEVNGILLDINHLGRIPEYIYKILDNKGYAEALGIHAKAYAKQKFWSWDERMNAELEVVNTLMAGWEFNTLQ